MQVEVNLRNLNHQISNKDLIILINKNKINCLLKYIIF